MAHAAIQGDYTDLRFIKSRKVAVISIEIPIEAANEFVGNFGTPSPSTGVPVALARLNTATEILPATKQARKMHDLPLPQQAALLCDRDAFARFVLERHSHDNPITFIREWCGVPSRGDIKPGSQAAERFHTIKGEFDVWMASP